VLKLVIIMWLITPELNDWIEVGRYETKGECWQVAMRQLDIRLYGPNAAIQCLYENETP
jgi:hypothetical protein